MAGPLGVNNYLAAEKAGLTLIGNYTGAASDKAAVQVLIDLIKPEETSVHRGFMDQMSPTARLQLLVELDGLYAKVS